MDQKIIRREGKIRKDFSLIKSSRISFDWKEIKNWARKKSQIGSS